MGRQSFPLNQLGNLMNIESNAHNAYDNLHWGIEDRVENGTACNADKPLVSH